MKHILLYVTVIIGLSLYSCGTVWDEVLSYTEYQVENKLDTVITLQLADRTQRFPNLFYTIPSNSTKTIVFSANGLDGYSPSHLKMIVVSYKQYSITDSAGEGNSLINIDAYKILEESTYKKKVLHTLRFTIDSTYVKEHLK